MKKICVVGTGYVGLVTGACFAELGNDVVCLDIAEEKIKRLRAGEMTIYEPGLEPLVRRNVSKGRLRFTSEYAEAVADVDYCFIAVNTPTVEGAGADMTYVERAASSIAQHVTRDVIIINKSTMPVGGGDLVSEIAKKNLADSSISISVVSNPEFLREGSAVRDFLEPDRVVLGSFDQAAARRVGELYVALRAPIVITDLYTAEMIKYASNAFLATKISFINEMARICDQLGADVKEVAAGMGYDKRIGRDFLNAGLGFGGSCFEGDETVFALNSPNVAVERFDTLFSKGTAARAETDERPSHDGVVELAHPADQRVLAFDLETGQPTLADVQVITRRPYKGQMVTIKTSMGRTLKVTADHPVVLHREGAFDIVPAAEVRPDNELMALTELPTVTQASQPLNLIELLRGTALEADVYVTSDDDVFTSRYREFAAAIPSDLMRYPDEIRRYNRMSLRLFRHLTEVEALDVPADTLKLYTAKGSATMIRALIPVDADFLRFCGYYLAEGYIGLDNGRAGAVRERVGLCFHENEAEYIADVQRILTRWGMKFIERRATSALTTVVSSRIFAWLLRDVLKCGVRSEDKALPRLAFNVSPALRHEVIRGAMSGDGSVTTVQGGKNLMLEYATVSKALADGMALLLQSVGVTPSLKSRMMNKSTQAAFILRVSGYDQISALADAFGGKRREQIARLLAGYQRHIKPHGYQRKGSYAVLTVHEVWSEPVEAMVYSMETSTGTLIASSGLICHNCFPKDVKALSHMASEAGLHPQLLEAVMKINQDQRHVLIEKLAAEFGGEEHLLGKTVAALGLAFKDNTDDMREAPSIDVIHWLTEAGATVRAYDPVATETAKVVLPAEGVIYCEDEYSAATGADAVVVLTEWKRFLDLDMERLRAVMRDPETSAIVIDGRNLFDPEEMARLGIRYQGIGRGNGRRRAALFGSGAE